MERTGSFVESPSGTREEIMRATYLALCEHGYAGLTIARIGEEFPKSKSLIYHHHDGKDALLLDFLEFMLDRYEATMPLERPEDPEAHLEAVLDYMFLTPLPDEHRDFLTAMVELRSQAAHDEDYRAHFTRHDRFFVERLSLLVEAGIESGDFADVDSEVVASFVLNAMNGSLGWRLTTDDDPAEDVRAELEAYLRARLLPDDS